MSEELQKRIYFYIDASQVKNEETVSRIYLAANGLEDSYSYSILPGQKLIWTEDYASHTPIKWEMVYDMEGYYFYGTVAAGSITEASSTGSGENTNKVEVLEYLRPIQYDFDTAVYGTVEDSEDSRTTPQYQQLLKVGNQTVEDFLTEIFKTDGYAGTYQGKDETAEDTVKNYVVITSDNVSHIYYPVQVDEEGKGVWAYLCTYGEIMSGFDYDEKLESLVDNEIQAAITLTAVNGTTNSKIVTDEEELRQALNDSTTQTISLGNAITLSSTLEITKGSYVLNLNGFGIEGKEVVEPLLQVDSGASLTVLNGTLQTTQTDTNGTARSGQVTSNETLQTTQTGILVEGGYLTLGHVTLQGSAGIVIQDHVQMVPQSETQNESETETQTEISKGTLDSQVMITNSTITTTGDSLLVLGNGSATDTRTRVVIQDSKLVSTEGSAICGQDIENTEDTDNTDNTDTGTWGTEIILLNTEVQGENYGIYHPQRQSTLRVLNSKVTGNIGIYMEGGSLYLTGGTVTGQAANSSTGVSSESNSVGISIKGTTKGSVYALLKESTETIGTIRTAGTTETTETTGNTDNTEEGPIVSGSTYALSLEGIAEGGTVSLRIEGGTYSSGTGYPAIYWNGIGTLQVAGGSYNGKLYTEEDATVIEIHQEEQE
jgi:hypothetical protein